MSSSVNSTIRSQLDHRTIRKWREEPVSDEVRELLLSVAQRTATAVNLQHSGIVRVTDPTIREGLAEVGKQHYLAEAPELWIFIVDTARCQAILDERGVEGPGPSSMDAFTEGFTDACLMAQNVVTAAESLGLGTNYFGCILNDPARVIDLLGLPPLTFPVLGLGFGIPAQEPRLKPRIPFELRVSENRYERPSSWSDALVSYDEALQTYYDLRDPSRPVAAFTDQVEEKLVSVNPKRAQILRVVAAQGFDLDLGE